MNKILVFLFLLTAMFPAVGQTNTICVSVDCPATFVAPVDSITLNSTVTTTAATYKVLWQTVKGVATVVQPSAINTSAVGFSLPGTYVFSCTGTTFPDGNIYIAYDTINFQGTSNVPPVCVISTPPNPVTGTSIQLNASGSFDADGTIIKHGWGKLAGPGTQTILNANTPTPTITGLQNGTYTFKDTVWDNLNATGAAQVTFNVLQGGGKIIVKIVATFQDGTTQQLFP